MKKDNWLLSGGDIGKNRAFYFTSVKLVGALGQTLHRDAFPYRA
jgi:hypothetical protein